MSNVESRRYQIIKNKSQYKKRDNEQNKRSHNGTYIYINIKPIEIIMI